SSQNFPNPTKKPAQLRLCHRLSSRQIHHAHRRRSSSCHPNLFSDHPMSFHFNPLHTTPKAAPSPPVPQHSNGHRPLRSAFPIPQRPLPPPLQLLRRRFPLLHRPQVPLHPPVSLLHQLPHYPYLFPFRSRPRPPLFHLCAFSQTPNGRLALPLRQPHRNRCPRQHHRALRRHREYEQAPVAHHHECESHGLDS
ncbi:unnamed protein product, partial [Linum tenue]